MSNPNDFDAVAKAVESGDLDALDKLMASEETPETKEEVPAEPEDPALEGLLKEDATSEEDKSEESPKNDEVVNGAPAEEATPTEAATPAASTATPNEREKELEREVQRYKSDAGRVPFIQRRMAELERELRAYKAREAQPTQGVAKVTAEGVELDEETKKYIEELRETDPVMAKTMERVAKAAIAGSKAQVDSAFDAYTKAEQSDADESFLDEQRGELLQEIPRAYEIFAMPQWSQWKQSLTPGQRAMAESSYAKDVKQAIYAFAAVMQQQQPQQVTATAQPAAVAPVVATPASTEVSDKVKEARARKVSAAAEVPTASAKKAVEFDEAQAFREMYEKIGKQHHILK